MIVTVVLTHCSRCQSGEHRPVSEPPETMLEMARRHVCEGEKRVERQMAIIAAMEKGNYTRAAALGRQVLETMRVTLDVAKHHVQRLEIQSKR
jgi:hypothetical protein